MKWIKPNGTRIETNDEPATLDYGRTHGWKEQPIDAIEEKPDEAEEMQLREGAIAEAIVMIMACKDGKNLIANGMPNVNAVSELTGFEITAEERNNAYNNLMKDKKQ